MIAKLQIKSLNIGDCPSKMINRIVKQKNTTHQIRLLY